MAMACAHRAKLQHMKPQNRRQYSKQYRLKPRSKTPTDSAAPSGPSSSPIYETPKSGRTQHRVRPLFSFQGRYLHRGSGGEG